MLKITHYSHFELELLNSNHVSRYNVVAPTFNFGVYDFIFGELKNTIPFHITLHDPNSI